MLVMATAFPPSKKLLVVGGGPAGLAAAEVLVELGHQVHVFDAMPTFGRKFLMAGKSGLNLTHAEPYERFATRFGAANERLRAALDAFSPEHLRDWAHGLGSPTFVGSSNRVFPETMKASPLLRAWLRRLAEGGVHFHPRHRFVGFEGRDLCFDTPEGSIQVVGDGVLFALGGASWPRLGSDGAWADPFRQAGIGIADFQPANCGFDVEWTEPFRERFAGAPVKSVVATSETESSQGEFVVTRHGVEGSLIYARSAALRDAAATGRAVLRLDLVPGRREEDLVRSLRRLPGKASFATRLRRGAGLSDVKAGLIRERSTLETRNDPVKLARMIKHLAVPLLGPRPIAEAISSAGGVQLGEVDPVFMLHARPGTFVAGEMLDWEAPTGGYLLTACFATGRAAAYGLNTWLQKECG